MVIFVEVYARSFSVVVGSTPPTSSLYKDLVASISDIELIYFNPILPHHLYRRPITIFIQQISNEDPQEQHRTRDGFN
jgi:hypothetical protein